MESGGNFQFFLENFWLYLQKGRVNYPQDNLQEIKKPKNSPPPYKQAHLNIKYYIMI